jgi:hypothetical protein
MRGDGSAGVSLAGGATATTVGGSAAGEAGATVFAGGSATAGGTGEIASGGEDRRGGATIGVSRRGLTVATLADAG